MSDQRYALPGHHAHVFISTLLTQHRYQNVNGGRALTEEEITGLLIATLLTAPALAQTAGPTSGAPSEKPASPEIASCKTAALHTISAREPEIKDI